MCQYHKDKAKEDSLVEDQGVGLYEIGDDFIYRGEVKNNYVRFAGKDKLFRIIRFSEDDNTVRLFEDMQVGEELRVPWDDRFNPYRSDYTGINDYMVDSINSRVKDTLQNYYNSAVWPDDMKAYIVTQDLCVGKRSKEDITKDGSTECSVKLANQQFGLLNVYEYLQASLDKNCNSTTAIACQNYNWFATYAKKVWTVNGDPDNTSKVWYILQTVNQSNANSPKFCNVVFNISDKVTYISGDGTHDNPYVIR